VRGKFVGVAVGINVRVEPEPLTAKPVFTFAQLIGIVAQTLTVVVAVPTHPPPVAVRVTVYVPGVVYVWVAVAPDPFALPSPKFHEYVVPAGAPLLFAVKVRVSPVPVVDDMEAAHGCCVNVIVYCVVSMQVIGAVIPCESTYCTRAATR
jgi:hypothetical protein